MNARIRKIWKDLAERKARSLTTLAGLVIGLWGIGTVSIAWVILSNDLTENYTRTLPPDVVVTADAGAQSRLDEIPGLTAADNRPLLRSRIEVADNFYLPLQLFVVDDFSNPPVARFFPASDEVTPPFGEMFIERSGDIVMKMYRARVASSDSDPHRISARDSDRESDLTGIQLPGGIKVQTRLSGKVFDAGLAPSNQEQIIYGYISRETAESWMPDGLPNRWLLRTEPGQQQRVATAVSVELEQNGTENVRLDFPDPARHPHQFQMDTILVLLAGLGAVAFLAGAVLVVNLVNGILTNQIRQLGALKAMGGTVHQVMSMYLSSQFLLGLASCVLALPLATRSAYWLSNVISMMLNFDILTTTIPVRVYAILIVAGTLLPVLAAWSPVRRWSRVPVRAALDNHGTSRNAGSGQGAGLPSFRSFASRMLPLSVSAGLRNSIRKPVRFALTVATVAIGAVIFMMAMNMRSSIVNTADIEESTVLYDVSVAFEEDTAWNRISWIEQFGVVNRLELWPATRASFEDRDIGPGEDVLVIATPEDSWAIRPNLVEGAWISDQKPEGVVATHRFLNRFPHLELGDRFTLDFDDQPVEVELVGVEKRFGPGTLRMPLSGYLDLTGAEPGQGRVALIDLDAETARNTSQFIPLLESHFSVPGLKVAQVSTSRLAARVIRNHLDVIVVMLGFVAGVMLLISGLGMASGTSTSVIERTRELGVLRAIGATPLGILRILSVEALTVAMAGCLLAAIVADPLSRRLEAYFGNGIIEYPFDHRFSWEGMIVCFGIVAVLSLAATLGPARLVTRGPVRNAVSYE